MKFTEQDKAVIRKHFPDIAAAWREFQSLARPFTFDAIKKRAQSMGLKSGKPNGWQKEHKRS